MEMDPSRYGLQQGWDNNSALEGYDAVHDPNFRAGGSYDERRFRDERYSREDSHPRNAYPPPPPDTGVWSHSQPRRRSYEEEYPLDRESRRHTSYNDLDSFQEYHKFRDNYHGNNDNYRDHGFDRPSRVVSRDRDDYAYDDHDYRPRSHHQNREDSRERDYDLHSYDPDYDRGSKRDASWRRRGSRDRSHDKRGPSWERDLSPNRSYDRSRSSGRDDRSRSRSPRGRSYGRSRREDRYDDDRYERSEKRRDGDEKRQRDHYSVAPSPTVVVKGLSQKTTEEDLYQMLAEWGPLRHVRVIKERNSGISRGFAFIDFPSVGAARAMMDRIGDDGLVVDDRKLFFEYSSKPTGSSGSFGQENTVKSGQFSHRGMIVSSDWMCTICGCVNFARRTSCFQCNEPRGEDAPPADIALSYQMPSGKKGSETGPTHVLVVRGLDENADEEMLRYEFSKHAPVKDIRLVRDKFTHVSRGFTFVHFHTVEEATKALEATNGTTLEKNGQILRVAYAKSIIGPGSGTSGSSQPSSLAAAAIEAAAFSQQYDAVGWAPKEYNPDDKQPTGGQEQGGTTVQQGSAPQSGFVWDEASGYYYDAASGFYYDGNTGLYYDGNNAIWYSYDNQTQQYIPCTDQTDNNKPSNKQSEPSNNKKAVISAPASVEKVPTSLPDAVQAAANAAIAAEKKEKERVKEIKLASKSSIIANKKKMNNVLTMWKQRSHESQAPRLALDQPPSSSIEDKQLSMGQSAKKNMKSDVITANNSIQAGPTQTVSNSGGRTLMGVIRGSGRGSVKLDTSYVGPSSGISSTLVSSALYSSTNAETPTIATPFRTDASALGSYSSNPASGSGKRRFSETPLPAASTVNKEQVYTAYRDRAAERRSLYGSSASIDDNPSVFGESNRDSSGFKKGSSDPMPFPPGVGGRGIPSENVQSYDVIPADKAIDESNVGNRMLRNMGWQEGLGLGKDGSGMVEPVLAQGMDRRAGLGSQQKTTDPSLEVHAGDSYKTLIQKKALARFREMSEP